MTTTTTTTRDPPRAMELCDSLARGEFATVRAETGVEFLTISRADYNRILGAVTEEQLAEKINFLHALPAFAGVPMSMIRSAAYVLSTREYARNAVVFKPAAVVPHSAHLFVEALLEAGVPPRCLQPMVMRRRV